MVFLNIISLSTKIKQNPLREINHKVKKRKRERENHVHNDEAKLIIFQPKYSECNYYETH